MEPLNPNPKGRYLNPHVDDIRRRPKDFILWMCGYFRDVPFDVVPEGFSYPIPQQNFNAKKPWAMWIGHSTYLISVGDKHILTDPIWSKRCSPVPFFGPKRKTPPVIPLERLPKIDYVLISHDHYDHLDKYTIDRLHQIHPDILWVVPKGLKKWFENFQIKTCSELNWWEEITIDSRLRVTAVPSQHFSGRRAPDLNKTLWAGFVVEDLLHNKTFYFVGDTGYNHVDFKEIGKKFKNIDLSLIPIGSYSPRKFMASVHVEPEDSVNIHRDVSSKFSLGMHWKTFKLSEEPMNQPPFDLYCAIKRKKLDPASFLAIEPGYKVNW